ncbi:MAG: amino acid ABC transporter substrate-binding protein [Ruthenibacterium sp.]
MKKVIATILSIATLCTVLAGCGKTVTTSVSSTPEATTSVPVSTSINSTSEEAGPVAAYTTSLEDIKAKGELVIGLDDTFAPMGFRDEAGNLVGFDIELATAVCEELGVKAKFQTIDWDAKELELTSGNIDCIWNGMSITDERQQSMSLSQPYLNNIISVMTTNKVEVRAFTDLNGLNIGIQAGSAALEAVQGSSVYDSIKDSITEYPTYDEAILDMQAGRLDCLIIDEVYGSYKNSKMNNIFMPSRIDFGDDLYAIGFRKSDSALCNSVNDAINALIANGKAAEISTKWFGKDIVVKP